MQKALMLVHGIFSSAKTWESLIATISTDEDLTDLFVATFEYATPKFNLNPARAIPDYDDIALKLWTFLQTTLKNYEQIAIVAHSQGGLIIQRMLTYRIEDGSAQSLARIKQIVLRACPNSGSDLFLALRRYTFILRNPQERSLRPLDKGLERTRSVILEKVVHAKGSTATTAPIAIYAYAGETDGVVKSQSALSAFINKGVLEGDHSSILDFKNPSGLNYVVIKGHLLDFMRARNELAPRPDEAAPTHKPGVMPQPVQLPRAIPDLRGRDDEVRKIKELLTGSQQSLVSRVALISGRGGIGKTALAVTIGTLVKSSYRDGVLFANLDGTETMPADPDQVLLSFLISLGIPVDIASNPATDKGGLYRSLMTGRRRLVILDNAKSPKQVESLLPSDPLCGVIITTRSRFSSMRCDLRINLGPLTQESSQEILESYLDSGVIRARLVQDQLASLAELCGRWPLVLHLAGALVFGRSVAAVSDLIARLGDEKTRLASLHVGELELRLVLGDSLRQLSADGAALFQRLSLVPGEGVPSWIIGILLGSDPVRSRSALSELIEANLLEPTADLLQDRYFMHDLVRDMSREGISAEDPDDLRSTRRAVLLAYRDRAVLSRKVLELDRPPYGTMDTRLSPEESALLAEMGSPERWLEQEKGALMAAVDQAYQLGLDEIAVSIANSLPTYFVIRGTCNEWSSAYETAIKAAERSRDLTGLGYLLQGLANIQRTKGEGTGLPSLERSLAVFEEAGDEVGRAYVMNDIGLVRMYEGRWSESDEALRDSERRLAASGHLVMALQPRRNRAISLLENGDASTSADELEQVCDKMNEYGDVRWRAYSLADLGKAYRLLGQPDLASERLRSAIEIMLGIGDSRWAAVTRIRLGDVYRSADQSAEARAEYSSAAELFTELADPLWGARALISTALVDIDEGDLDNAMDLYEQAQRVFITLNSEVDVCWAFVVQSRVYAAMGSELDAATALAKARDLARGLGRDDTFIEQLQTDTGPDVR
jgi:tetratricopeptide (TPR) repeat protein/pimeloyl-ACP methyl ester carboxylesterase